MEPAHTPSPSSLAGNNGGDSNRLPSDSTLPVTANPSLPLLQSWTKTMMWKLCKVERGLSWEVPICIAEIASKELRGGLATLTQLMFVIGVASTLILGIVVTWKTLALTCILPCLVLLLGLLFIPESPRWLAKAGHQKEFIDALRRFRGDDADISHEAAETQENLQSLTCMPKVGLLDLFDIRYLHVVTVSLLAS